MVFLTWPANCSGINHIDLATTNLICVFSNNFSFKVAVEAAVVIVTVAVVAEVEIVAIVVEVSVAAVVSAVKDQSSSRNQINLVKNGLFHHACARACMHACVCACVLICLCVWMDDWQ